MLTGHVTIHYAIEALKVGASYYLTKPCDLKDLIFKSEQTVVSKKAHQLILLDARMEPYIPDRDQEELISRILHIK